MYLFCSFGLALAFGQEGRGGEVGVEIGGGRETDIEDIHMLVRHELRIWDRTHVHKLCVDGRELQEPTYRCKMRTETSASHDKKHSNKSCFLFVVFCFFV